MIADIDVVIPCYNGEKFIQRAIESVLNQTISVNRIIVVNDGSTDRTFEVLTQLACTDDRVMIISQPNLGLSAARNIGIKHSNAGFIALLDADDYWLPNKLENQLTFLKRNPKHIGVSSLFKEKVGNVIRHGKRPPRLIRMLPQFLLLQLTFIPGSGSSLLLRREILTSLGTEVFDTNLRFAEDLDCWVRLSMLGSIGVVSSFDVIIEIQPESMQRRIRLDPLPYFANSLLILEKHRYLVSKFIYFVHAHYIFFQVLRVRSPHPSVKGNALVFTSRLKKLRIHGKEISPKLVSFVIVPPYYLFRKLITVF